MNVNKPMLPTLEILGTALFSGTIEQAVQLVLADCEKSERSNHCISATGAHGLVLAKSDKYFNATLKSFYLNLLDGMPSVWIARLKGDKKAQRCYGPDFFKSVMLSTRNRSITHFFCGGLPGVADSLKLAVKSKFGNTNVTGTFCPPFVSINEYDFNSIAEKINITNPNFVWIGIGTPKQELFAARLAPLLKCNFLVTVGATFDFYTDRVTEAPKWIQRIGMEWFFRLCMEPKRLYRRYFTIVPQFIYFNFLDFITFAFQKKGK